MWWAFVSVNLAAKFHMLHHLQKLGIMDNKEYLYKIELYGSFIEMKFKSLV